jgi:hypothetical protein
MKLSIVIPALNEEQAIGAIIERCLAARRGIAVDSPVEAVEIIVVSDGSTDRTAEIASGYEGIELIIFEKNRGYGAAIKAGFERSTGDLVGFLDADGTCDPTYFGPMCRKLVEQRAAVVLGSRMGPGSCMPRIRRIGNRIYALILSSLANRPVTDTASGMRVIRRDALRHLYPLPDGLHFTPAMSARALLDDHLRIVEVPIAYEERVGESKLSVVRDGVRFLRTILAMTLMWRPARLFLALAVACLASMVLLAMHPIEAWMRIGSLEETTIYRLLFCSFLGAVGLTLMSSAALADNVHRLVAERPPPRTFLSLALDRVYTLRSFVWQSAAAVPVLMWLVGPGLVTRILDGYVAIHWSRVVLAGLLAFAMGQSLVTVLLANIIRFHTCRKSLTATPKSADRVILATSQSERYVAPSTVLAPEATANY